MDAMQVYKVPESLYDQYHGCGLALAAIRDGQLQAIQYLEDLDPEFYFEGGDQRDMEEHLRKVCADLKVGQASKYLATIGEVSVGMLSCYEFVEM